ncbi:MAG: efflux RND transporter permease subunit [Alkalispirochaeta sp.]
MKYILRAPLLIVIVILAITAFFAAMLPRVELDNDVMSFVPENHPAKEAFERLDEIYDTDLSIVVAIHNPRGPILTADGVEHIRRVTDRIEEIENVTGVQSLTSIDYIDGDEEGMTVEELAAGFDGTTAAVDQLRRRLRSWEAYDGALVSDDFHSSQLVVEVPPNLDAAPRQEVYSSILDILDELEAELNGTYEYYVAGEPAITVLLSANMQSDIITLIPIVIVVVLLSLLLFFRRLGGVVLPMITVLISTVWTIGLMALLGVKLSIVATVIPVLMIAVGSAYGIHIINHYYDEVARRGGVPEREGRREIVLATLRRVGVPVFMAGVTTIVGFGALATSEVAPMRDFGIFTAVGVAVALLVALTLIPALLILSRVSGRGHTLNQEGSAEATSLIPRGYLVTLYRFFGRRKRRILIAAVILAGVAAWGSSMLVVDNQLISYFKRDTDIRRADEFLREHFLGTRSFDINVSGESPGDLTRPEILTAMDGLAAYLEEYEQVSQVMGYTDFIKRMNQMMNIGVPAPGYERGADSPAPAEAAADAGPASDSTEEAAGDPGGGGFSGGFSSDEGFTADDPDAPTDQSAATDQATSTDEEGFGGGFSASNDEGFSTGDSGDDFFGSALSGGGAADEAPAGGNSPTAASGAGADRALGSIAEILNDAYAMADRSEISAEELVRLVNRRTNYQGAAFYEIPADPSRYPAETTDELANLISQYLLLYSGSLENYADDPLEPRQARMTVQLLNTGNGFTRQVVRDIEEYVAAEFPEGYEIEIAGVAIVEMALTDLITNAQIMSIAVSLSLVFLIVALTYRSIVAGLYGIIPLGLTLVVNFGVMGFFGIKLDVSTAMVASIAIGIGIDYTIHFLSAYSAERRESDDLEQVELNVLSTTGKAITFNAVSVGAGFAVLLLSNFYPLMYMGMLIALTMLTSSIASMTVLPVMLDVFTPAFMQPRRGRRW